LKQFPVSRFTFQFFFDKTQREQQFSIGALQDVKAAGPTVEDQVFGEERGDASFERGMFLDPGGGYN
jgi:hypothetical protein